MSLRIHKDLGVQCKTSFVLAHKIHEAIGSIVQNDGELLGEVEVDGAYFRGHVKQENRKAGRRDRRLAEERTGKRQVVVITEGAMVERFRWSSSPKAPQFQRSVLGWRLAPSFMVTNRPHWGD
jgi:hypothetical protein